MRSLAFDLGGHNISAALVSAGGDVRILNKISVKTPESRELREVASAMSELAVQLLAGGSCCFSGMGLPGFIGSDRRTVKKLTNFPIADVDFVSAAESAFADKGIDVPIYIENDANCAALGEGLCGAARGLSDYVVFTLGTGIGSGIVTGGRLLTGAHGIAGEAGHVSTERDVPCACGGTGHAEGAAGADSVQEAAAAIGLPGSFRELWSMRERPEAEALLGFTLDAIARCIASVTVITDPQLVVLNGGVSRAAGIADAIRERTLPLLPEPFRAGFKITLSELGDDAALYGASLLGAQNS